MRLSWLNACAVVVAMAAMLVFSTAAPAQFQCPAGSTQEWHGSGYGCRCPDGSWASIGGCASQQYQSNVNRCPNGGTCQLNQTCCGNMCCGSGSYCSIYGCTPNGAIQCGNGFCNPGLQCTRNGRCIPAGTIDCGNWYCQPGQRCGSSHNNCLNEGETDCGSYTCRSGYKCSSSGCIDEDAVDCGNKTFCRAGTKCSRGGKKCLEPDAVDCGSYSCNVGWKCGSGNQCIQRDAVDCGGGRSCPAGHLCLRGGAECMTRAEIAERQAEEKRQKEEEIAERRRQLEEQREAARQEAQRKKEEAEQRVLEGKRAEQERLNALARQKQEEQLRQAAEKQRQAELQRAAKQKQQELQRMTGASQGSCDYQKIVAISQGRNPDSVVCASTVAPQQQSGPVTVPAVSDKQLQYPQQNAVRLQPPAFVPEPRMISLQPESIAAPAYPVCSTFNDPSLPKNGCASTQASQPEAAPAGQVKPDEQTANNDQFHDSRPRAGDAGQQHDIVGTLCKTEVKEECRKSGAPLLWWTWCIPAEPSQSGDIARPERSQWCQKSTRNWVYEKSLIGAPNCSPGEWTKQEKVCQPKSYKQQPDIILPVLK